jgi:hypothetical protein
MECGVAKREAACTSLQNQSKLWLVRVECDKRASTHLGRDHGHFVTQKLLALLMASREELCSESLHAISVLGWNTVPVVAMGGDAR